MPSQATGPMNDTACDKYGGCNFCECCSKSPGVRERFPQGRLQQGGTMEPTNPPLKVFVGDFEVVHVTGMANHPTPRQTCPRHDTSSDRTRR